MLLLPTVFAKNRKPYPQTYFIGFVEYGIVQLDLDFKSYWEIIRWFSSCSRVIIRFLSSLLSLLDPPIQQGMYIK